MLDNRRNRVAWVIERDEGHEQRVVAQAPGRARIVAALVSGEIMGLCGAGLSSHLDAAQRQLRRSRGSVIDYAPHRLADEIQMVLVDLQMLLRGDRLVLEQPRNHPFASREAAGHHRQLERVDEHHALADRHVDRVVSLPLAVIFAHHPLGIGNGPIALVVERQVELLAKAHRTDHRRELLGPDTKAHAVEIDVAAVDHCRVHIDRTVPPVAVESVIAELKGAGAIDLLGAVDPGVEQRHRHRWLDRRSGRVEALQCFVDERQVIVLAQHLPFVLANAVREIVGIEGRHRRHRQDVAVGHVDHHHRRRLVADPPRRILVQVGIDRQLHRIAAAVGLGLELLDQLAARGDLDPLPARLAAQRLLQRLLEPFLADLHARDQQQRVLVFLLIFCS
jgi:hypothetical protein